MFRKIPAIFFVVSFTLAGLEESAQSASYCHSFEQFDKPVKRCEDNFVLASSAMDCVDGYEAAIKQGKARIQKKLAAQVAKMKQQQSGSFNTTDVSYNDTRAELTRLIADGELTKASAKSMLEEIFYPEDFDNEDILGMSAEKYLATEPCFASPRFAMENSVELIQIMIDDLKKTEVAAGLKEGTSETRSTNVQVLTPSAVSKGNAQGSAIPVPKGNTPKAASDITGSKKAIDDANKAKALIQQQPKK